jgi:hypothetical protein
MVVQLASPARVTKWRRWFRREYKPYDNAVLKSAYRNEGTATSHVTEYNIEVETQMLGTTKAAEVARPIAAKTGCRERTPPTREKFACREPQVSVLMRIAWRRKARKEHRQPQRRERGRQKEDRRQMALRRRKKYARQSRRRYVTRKKQTSAAPR